MSRFFDNLFNIYQKREQPLKADTSWWKISDDSVDPLPEIGMGKIRVAIDDTGNSFILIGTPKGTVVFMRRIINDMAAILNSNLSKVSIALSSHVLVDSTGTSEEVLRSLYTTCVV